MRKIREVLRLKLGLGLKDREIARSCSISRSSVANYVFRPGSVSGPGAADMDRFFGRILSGHGSRNAKACPPLVFHPEKYML